MEPRKVFHDSIMPLPETEGQTEDGLLVQAAPIQPSGDLLTIHFALAIPADAQAKLEEAIASGKTVPAGDLQSSYAATQADADALESWLKEQGYTIEFVSPDHTSIYAKADAPTIEKSLDVKMARVTTGGFTYLAARNAPSLPENVGKNVTAIIGLQPYRQARKNARVRMPKDGNRASQSSGKAHGKTAPVPEPNEGDKPPYLVSEIMKAYNADGLPVNGSGQTIAILIDTFPSTSDLEAFWAHNSVPSNLNRVEMINVGGGQLPAPSGEETLDAEWTSGIAQGATIRIYASGSLAFADLDRAIDQIIADLPTQPGMRQLSISLGLGESYMVKDEVTTQSQKYLQLAAAGVNVFVSSGDDGSNPSSGGQGTTGTKQVEYGSSDPSVIGVGGTSLVLNTDGSVSSETAWPGSGGGTSKLFPRPAWQTGEGVAKGKFRLVPDVSSSADPNEGAYVYLNGQAQQIGGTSWAAPTWAAFCALMNQARENAKLQPLPFLNPLLYPLLGTDAFRDIVSGSNGGFKAKAGYDEVTGLGVADVKVLIAALTQAT